MAISPEVRLYVRQRAYFACEYCGVSETDTGSELTIDHFQPHTKGGQDDVDNLLYCCARCNQYKADYWPAEANNPVLWNREIGDRPRFPLPHGQDTGGGGNQRRFLGREEVQRLARIVQNRILEILIVVDGLRLYLL